MGKQTMRNYDPVSLLPIYGKIFVTLMFNKMFKLFIENKLILLVSLVLNQAIPASIDYYLLLMRYIVLLLKVLKLEVSSWISQRHLIRCGMMVLSANSKCHFRKFAKPFL